ncbi:MAG TPA: GNAT family N-acetyltransferase [Jiangellaceae bacterium]|nr:GNAT family N-acetyltransferase [Jiangellaceae bacterium]
MSNMIPLGFCYRALGSTEEAIVDSVKEFSNDGSVTVTSERVAAVRSFSRFFTSVIGVLDEGLLNSPYSLSEARVIFELAQADVTEVVALRRTLDLDPGYLSRILARFEADGLVARERSGTDGRRQTVRLTEAGHEVFRMLDSRSADQVEQLLGAIPDPDQQRVVAAMATIQSALAARPGSSVRLRALRPGDLGWVVHRHGVLYADEYGWDATFEALVAQIVAHYVAGHDPHRENGWIAELDGQPVGCVFCVRGDDENTAKLRLLLVEPSARGLGIGARLVDACVRFARGAGYHAITLWTNDVLAAACRIYQRAGFELVKEEKHRSFGHDLVGQYWRLELSNLP